MSDLLEEYGPLMLVAGVVSALLIVKVVFLDPKPVAQQVTQSTAEKKPTKQEKAAQAKANNKEAGNKKAAKKQKKLAAQKLAKAKAAKVQRAADAKKTAERAAEAKKLKAAKAKAAQTSQKAAKAAAAAASSQKAAAPAAAVGGKPLTKNQKKKAKAKAKKKAEAALKNPTAAATTAAATPVAAAPVQQQVAADDTDGWTTIAPRKKAAPAKKKSATSTEDDGVAAPKVNSIVVIVDEKYHRVIIGQEGSTLHMLEDATNTKINVPNRDSGNKEVTVSGSDPNGIQQAKKAIEQLVAKGYSNITDPGKSDSMILVPPLMRKTLIGPGGKSIKAIQQETNVNIITPDRESKSDQVYIVGAKEDVRLAKAIIAELLHCGFCEVTHPGIRKEEIRFPFEKIGYLVGPGGVTIKRIQKKTGARINKPQQLGMPLVIIGTREGIAEAKILIDAAINPPVEPGPPQSVQELEQQLDNKWSTVPEYGNWYSNNVVISDVK